MKYVNKIDKKMGCNSIKPALSLGLKKWGKGDSKQSKKSIN